MPNGHGCVFWNFYYSDLSRSPVLQFSSSTIEGLNLMSSCMPAPWPCMLSEASAQFLQDGVKWFQQSQHCSLSTHAFLFSYSSKNIERKLVLAK